MLTRRIIPCLDVKDGDVVKGVNFENLVSEGDPAELAEKYSKAGADELVFLDITATLESRKNVMNLVKQVAKKVFIPFTVGGGIQSIRDIAEILRAGADKVAINSAALKNPNLLYESALVFGSQCIVLAIDVKFNNNLWTVYSHGGSIATKNEAVQWARQAVSLGAGEILLTSMDADGTQDGVDLEITRKISRAVNVPIIASGGIGRLEHFSQAIVQGEADAVLAASVFHRSILAVNEIKMYLNSQDIPVRLTGDNNEL
tara:strand:- start:6422 stop:7198 length:777 start_codon:yes stop_codon:yes gene_type:complete